MYKMMRKINKQNGFTLIEMIVVLILVGIMATFAGLAIVMGVQGFMFSKNNAAISEKAQLALARINRELLECYNCSVTINPNLGTTPFSFTNTLGQRYFRLNTTDINNKYVEISNNIGFLKTGATSGINNYSDILINNVNSFTMDYSATGDKSIRVTMSLNHPDSSTALDFSTNVFPRNTTS